MLVEPPFALTEGADVHWRRHTARIHAEGRIDIVNLDALATYCDCLAMYQQAMHLIYMEGMTRDGERGGMTKHPAITILTGLRADMWRYARLIPLYDAAAEPGDGLENFLADAESWANG
ncbi:P27 family phage terminase small subunit [Nocardia terpenica]|uniref:P27 family phage terminase small subunit n=1 Tax=Nocardia terpenica TaxID=455432 RepID=UPI001894F18A|nr:P27 family phage terminase small subunit [Nocardia terpenica]MBF6060525.1 P27 family phage terminase small subunit [Nocardia terpenica]MBF6103785.1 P27 family phage terminase small subunit [Nocardia terpenica]MBF6111841.1 P27 family phage terminase small subunit [Nocardia terpenica]MBF6118006.1 P27 family phage terminase small subunit [Nocardia terpenica]MBF6155268.1 P27 family phage terminase small subunit [Nocardia terpenica]